MIQAIVLLLIALLGGPIHTWLPLATDAQPAVQWIWPKMGFGYACGGYGGDCTEQYDIHLLTNGISADHYWTYDWGSSCTRDGMQMVPMLWGATSRPPAACDDGRPLLILNEPERPEQANVSPAVAARMVHDVQWHGPIYCCGVMVERIDWMQQFVAAYMAAYGELPPLAGITAHVYNRGGVWVLDTNDPKYAVIETQRVDTFIAAMKQLGIFGKGLVLSEVGVLATEDYFSHASLVPSFNVYADYAARTPDILTWAWFSSNYPQFSSGNLVHTSGLTELGQAWRQRVQ